MKGDRERERKKKEDCISKQHDFKYEKLCFVRMLMMCYVL